MQADASSLEALIAQLQKHLGHGEAAVRGCAVKVTARLLSVPGPHIELLATEDALQVCVGILRL